MIKVRLSIREVAMGPEGSVQRALEAAGIPASAWQAGLVKHWQDLDYFYYEYASRTSESGLVTAPEIAAEVCAAARQVLAEWDNYSLIFARANANSVALDRLRKALAALDEHDRSLS